MLLLLFHMQNEPEPGDVTNNVHFFFGWPRPLLYNKKEYIGVRS